MEPRRFVANFRGNRPEPAAAPDDGQDTVTRIHVLRRRVAAKIPDFAASLEWLLPARFAGLTADLSLMPLLADAGRRPDDGTGTMPYKEFCHAMAESGAVRRLQPQSGPARGAVFSRWMLFAYARIIGQDAKTSVGLWAADPVRGAQANWLPIGVIDRPFYELRSSLRTVGRQDGASLVLRPEFAQKL